MEEFKPRDFIEVAKQILEVIKEKCTFDLDRKCEICNDIAVCMNNHYYRAPEAYYMDWFDLAEILTNNFIPSNSLWETELMVIFDDLKGKPEDYFQENIDEVN